MRLKQFDIVQVSLSPAQGSEQKGVRPCLVVQTNGFRGQSSLTIVCPFTSNFEKIGLTEMLVLPSKTNGLSTNSKLMLRQVRIVSTSRVMKELGELESEYHDEVRNSLAILFDLNKDFA